MMGNFIWALKQCKGNYIALCDGDDYWIDSKKLQIQINFLEKNPGFSIISHWAKKDKSAAGDNPIVGKLENDIFEPNYYKYRFYALPTASIVFRNIINYPNWMFNAYGGDRAIIFLCTQIGNLKILELTCSTYRIHSGGIEQFYDRHLEKRLIRNIKEFWLYFEIAHSTFKRNLLKMIFINYFKLTIYYFKEMNINLMFGSVYSMFKVLLKYLFTNSNIISKNV
jgi:hypothetical protein